MKKMQDSWIKKELAELKSVTFLMIIVVFAAIGLILGFFIFSDTLTGPFKKVAYAQNGTTMDVLVETKVPSRARVEYGTAREYLNRLEMSEDFETEHLISLRGLLPDKAHVFRIVLEDQDGRLHTSAFYTIE